MPLRYHSSLVFLLGLLSGEFSKQSDCPLKEKKLNMLRLSVTKQLYSKGLQVATRRHIGLTACILQKATKSNGGMDPIQKLFLDKVREYQTKSKKLGEGKLLEVSPEFERKMTKETEGLRRRFGAGNLEEFPKFDFIQK